MTFIQVPGEDGSIFGYRVYPANPIGFSLGAEEGADDGLPVTNKQEGLAGTLGFLQAEQPDRQILGPGKEVRRVGAPVE